MNITRSALRFLLAPQGIFSECMGDPALKTPAVDDLLDGRRGESGDGCRTLAPTGPGAQLCPPRGCWEQACVGPGD